MRYFSYNMMYYRISKNEKNLFFGKNFAQVWAVTLKMHSNETIPFFLQTYPLTNAYSVISGMFTITVNCGYNYRYKL